MRQRCQHTFVAVVIALVANVTLIAMPAADAATPTVTATPTTDLGFRGYVTVRGRNLPANTGVRAIQCSTSPAGAACQDPVTGTTDGSGNVDLQVPFRRRVAETVGLSDIGPTIVRNDCIQAGVQCTVVVRTSTFPVTTFGTVPLTFDPSAPVPPPATLVVTPSIDLAARPGVGVSGSGFFPNHPVFLDQCLAEPGLYDLESCAGGSWTAADATGHIFTLAYARRYLGRGLRVTDCAATRGACVLRATTDGSGIVAPPIDVTDVARTSLGFDPNAAPASGPPVTVTPRTGLADHQLVTVAGSGFPAGGRVAVIPCRTAPVFSSAGDCDTNAPVTFLADATGAFHQQYAAPQFFADTRGEQVDCGASTPTCMLVIVDFSDSSLATLVPISFATHGPIPVVAFRSRSITEPTGANHSTRIDLALSEPTDHQVSVDWNTDDFGAGTAGSSSDYVSKYRTTIIPAGATTATVLVDVIGDRTDEPDEWFGVHIRRVLGATVGSDARITIRDDDPSPSVSLGDASVRETDGLRFAQVPVRLSAASAFPVSVHFRTYQFTARAGSDYVDTTGTLVIPANRTSGNVALVILGDNAAEGTEGLLVTIDTPTHATVADGDAVLTITDDD